MTPVSAIHDVILSFSFGTRKFQGKMTEVRLMSKDYVPTGSDIIVRCTLDLQNESDYIQIREMLNNESFQPMLIQGLSEMDGYYYVTALTETEKGGERELWKLQLNMEYAGKTVLWNVDGEEIDTDWDALDSSTDGDPTALVNYDKEAGVTDGGEYIQATTESQLVAGYLWWSNYSVEMDVYVATGAAGDQGEVLIRKQSLSNTDKLFYRLLIDIDDDEVRFEHVDSTPTTTVLKIWSKTLTAATYYTLMVIAQGNKFDCYIDGEYLGTVFDDRLVCGYYGLMAVSDTCRFDNLSVKHAKPIVAHLPVGAYDYNQIRMAATSRLNDDINADGLSRTIVAPDNPIEFKQRINQLNDPSVVLDLPFNEGKGDIVIDQSGNDNNGTITGAIWEDQYVYGRIWKTLKFDESQYIIVPEDEAFTTSCARAFTYEAMIKFDEKAVIQPNDHTIGGRYEATTAGNRSWLFSWRTATGESDLALYMVNTSNALTAFYTGNDWTPTYGQYYHLVVVYDGVNGEAHIYVDGVLMFSKTSGIPFPLHEAATGQFAIGRNTTATNGNIHGNVAFAELYNKALVTTEVKERYDQLSLNNPAGGEVKVWDTMGEDGLWDYVVGHWKFDEAIGGFAYDSSKANHTATLTTAPDWDTSSFNKWSKTCLDFERTSSEYLTVADHADFNFGNGGVDTPFSIEAWINVDSDALMQGIVSKYGGVGNMQWFLKVQSGNLIEFHLCNPTGSQNIYVRTPSVSILSTGGWYHVVATYDGNKLNTGMKVYINSVLQTLNYYGFGYVGMTDTVQDVNIGRYQNSNYFDGKMDEIKITRKELTAERILWNYENAPRTVDETQWERVTEIGHPFVGDLIVDNRKIRVSQGYQTRDSAGYGHELTPTINGYADGMWEYFPLYPFFYTATGGYFSECELVSIEIIEKYKVILEWQVSDPTTDEWIRSRWYITQNPIVNIELYEWNLKEDLRVGALTLSGYLGADTGYGHAPRFICMTLDKGLDASVDSSSFGDETEGLSILFGITKNLLQLVWQESSSTYSCYDRTDTWSVIQDQLAIDFDVKTPPYWLGIGFMSFDTSLLNSNNWDDNSLTGVEAGAITINDYPAGSYRAWVYATGANSDEDATFIITGAVSTSGTFTWTDISSSGEWSDPIDFIAGPLDDITYTVTRTGGTGAITLGELVIVPIVNRKNFPLDERNHALRLLDIQEMVE